MTFKEEISSENATEVPLARPSYGIGLIGLKGLVLTDTGTPWFTKTPCVGSKDAWRAMYDDR